jgi:pyruvate/2-oxoglutarate dehydrogenase complex dihydrolipoamide acyltransferase (E2) component
MKMETKVEHSAIDAQIIKVAGLIAELDRERAVLAEMLSGDEPKPVVRKPTKPKAPKIAAKPKAKAKRATRPTKKAVQRPTAPKRVRRTRETKTPLLEPRWFEHAIEPGPVMTAPALAAPLVRPDDWWASLSFKEGVGAALVDKDRDAIIAEMLRRQWIDADGLSLTLGALVEEGNPAAIQFCHESARPQEVEAA